MGFHRIPSLRLVKIGWVLFNRGLWARCASRKNAANRCLRQRRNLRGNGLHPSRSNVLLQLRRSAPLAGERAGCGDVFLRWLWGLGEG